jgi:hypothetical protein
LEAALFVCVVGLELGADGQAVHAGFFYETNARAGTETTAKRGVGGNAARDFIAQVRTPYFKVKLFIWRS